MPIYYFHTFSVYHIIIVKIYTHWPILVVHFLGGVQDITDLAEYEPTYRVLS